MLVDQILNPITLFDHQITHDAFGQVCGLADGIEGDDGQGGEMAETVSDGHDDAPDEAAIENEGDGRFATGAEGKIGCGGVGVERHDDGVDADQGRCDGPDGIGGIVKPGENSGNGGH